VSSIHKFKVEGIRGEDIDFAAFRGKKLLVANVASACGYTAQYQQLQELYEAFQDKLAIVGFPSNDFGGQEPGTNEEISQFCTLKYGVSFPMAAKVRIKGQAHPIYEWLTQRELNGVMDSEVQWNFHKFLLDEAGLLVRSLPSATSPLDATILVWLSPG
jgi:glutathione peroxidase